MPRKHLPRSHGSAFTASRSGARSAALRTPAARHLAPGRKQPMPQCVPTWQRGVTLIELMIVVAVIGLLSAVAVPGFKNYTVRARLVEALSLMQPAKQMYAEHYSLYGEFPENTDMGLPVQNPSSTVLRIQREADGTRLVAYVDPALFNEPDLETPYVAWVPRIETNTIVWFCSTSCPNNTRYSIPSRYLPGSCNYPAQCGE